MDRHYETKYHALENDHWWFRARRDAMLALAVKLCPDRSTRVLEIGCSTGVLIRQLQAAGYGSVFGVDISEEAIAECHRQGTTHARVMDAHQIDYPNEHFDLVTASDVLEHLADDVGALRDWHRTMKPGGVLIVFVPAFHHLWSEHDVANQHFRRYQLTELKTKAADAGFVLERESYWNISLFLPIAAMRGAKRMLRRSDQGGVPDSDLFPPAAPLNWALFTLLSGENAIFQSGVNFPFGVSAMIVARKPSAGRCA